MEDNTIRDCKKKLEDYVKSYTDQNICLAFSGGVDSSLLLKVLSEGTARAGKKVYAVTFDSRLHPSCDLKIAKTVAQELGGIHHIITVDELEQEAIRHNPTNRCYLCKRHLFQTIKTFAQEKGMTTIMDGTNEDDMHVYRPGIQALKELGILSPLGELHMTKTEVKALAAHYGISVASRPSTPCMATRLPYGTAIDYQVLEQIEKGEAYLRTLFSGNVRLRLHGETVRLEVDASVMTEMLQKRHQVIESLKALGFSYITLDLEGFRSGSMDINL